MKSIKNYDMYVALIHYPIKNKDSEVVTTAVTNMDIHDIARLSATFGFKNYYIVTPIAEQQALVERIVDHWRGDYGKLRNNKRSTALDTIIVSPSLEAVKQSILEKTGKKVELIATTARTTERSITMKALVGSLDKEKAYLLLFGTGWGLVDDIINSADYVLEPLSYETGYNHLSVRSAVSIIMDRLYNAIGGKV